MKKALSILNYIAYLAVSAWAIIALKLDIDALPENPETPGDQLSAGLGEAFGKLFIIFFAIFAAVSLLGLIVKIVYSKTDWVVFRALGVLFDLAFTAASGVLLYGSITGGSELLFIVIVAVLFALSALSLLSNFAK